jgi:hypothetical protein
MFEMLERPLQNKNDWKVHDFQQSVEKSKTHRWLDSSPAIAILNDLPCWSGFKALPSNILIL